ncbi:MAG: HAD hydrolase family protein [Acetatifactor sp.]|nr:HAD hydrolase family protein [Acetatifactor sp.]
MGSGEKKFAIKEYMPPVGMRIIKTVIAVFLCFVVEILRGDVTVAFYSHMAAIWCMRDSAKETKINAIQRIIGTVVGALVGLVTILLFPDLSIETKQHQLIHGVVISLMVGVVLYATVVIRKSEAAYFSTVVYLSIVINHISDADPYIFTWNRFWDTMIGIVIGLAVNSFRLPRRRNRKVLFVSGLDDTLLNAKLALSGYSRVELNRMIDDGAQFTISTVHTPAILKELLGTIELKLPAIVMDGAALYDVVENRYVRSYVISHKKADEMIKLLREHQVNWFSNVIIDDTLVIYYQESENEAYNQMVEQDRRSPYRNYVKRELPEGEDVVYFHVVERSERIESLYRKLEEKGLLEQLKVLKYDSRNHLGYSHLKIFNHNATKENMISYLQEMLEVEKVVTFGSIEGKYTHVIAPEESDRVVKIMKKEFEPLKWSRG